MLVLLAFVGWLPLIMVSVTLIQWESLVDMGNQPSTGDPVMVEHLIYWGVGPNQWSIIVEPWMLAALIAFTFLYGFGIIALFCYAVSGHSTR